MEATVMHSGMPWLRKRDMVHMAVLSLHESMKRRIQSKLKWKDTLSETAIETAVDKACIKIEELLMENPELPLWDIMNLTWKSRLDKESRFAFAQKVYEVLKGLEEKNKKKYVSRIRAIS
jgi:hypothetical protein